MRQGTEIRLVLAQNQTLFIDEHVPAEVTWNYFTAVTEAKRDR